MNPAAGVFGPQLDRLPEVCTLLEQADQRVDVVVLKGLESAVLARQAVNGGPLDGRRDGRGFVKRVTTGLLP